MINSYHQGDSRKLKALFYDTNDALFNPTTVTFKYKKPGASTVTYVYGTDAQVVRDTTGTYYVILTFDTPGTWHYEWQCTGGVEAEPRDVYVIPTKV
ncbi:MAG: hypothetical protein WC822_06115 [Candidatus Paceibacterota bacterium]|jgi:hypothetical protein